MKGLIFVKEGKHNNYQVKGEDSRITLNVLSSARESYYIIIIHNIVLFITLSGPGTCMWFPHEFFFNLLPVDLETKLSASESSWGEDCQRYPLVSPAFNSLIY